MVDLQVRLASRGAEMALRETHPLLALGALRVLAEMEEGIYTHQTFPVSTVHLAAHHLSIEHAAEKNNPTYPYHSSNKDTAK